MFRHLVLFRWTPAATPEAVATVTAGLAALPGRIEAIRSYRFGPDAGVDTGNFDYGVVAEFDDEAGYLTYRDHPDHRRLITDLVAPLVAERVAVQQRDEPQNTTG